MNSKRNYKVEDFLRDDYFISYALNIPCQAAFDWDELFGEYSELSGRAEIARKIIQGELLTDELSPEENELLKQRIFSSIRKENKPKCCS